MIIIITIMLGKVGKFPWGSKLSSKLVNDEDDDDEKPADLKVTPASSSHSLWIGGFNSGGGAADIPSGRPLLVQRHKKNPRPPAPPPPRRVCVCV